MANEAFFGVVTLEAGDSGILSNVRTVLKEHPTLRIVDEITHEARFRLVSACDQVENVRRVLGRPDALRLCDGWLRTLLVGSCELVEVACDPDEPASLWAAVEQLPEAARAASAVLVETHQGDKAHPPAKGGGEGGGGHPAKTLATIAHAPEELVELSRCVVLARDSPCEKGVASGHDKTLLYFRLAAAEEGSLVGVLNVLHTHSVNMIAIRSFVDLHDPKQVDFIATVQGHELDRHLEGAVSELRATMACTRFRILGSFAVRSGLRAVPSSIVAAT